MTTTGRWAVLTTELTEKLAAGRTAIKSGDSERAISLLSEVLVTGRITSEQEVEVRTQLAELLENAGRYQEALKAISKYEASVALLDVPRPAMAQVLFRLASLYRWLNEPPKAISYANNSLRIFSQQHYDPGIGAANALLGYVYWMIDEYSISRDYLLTALESQRIVNDVRALAQTYWNLSLVDSIEGHQEEAKKDCMMGLSLLEEENNQQLSSQDHLILGKLFSNLAFIDTEEGNIHKAVQKYERAIEHWSHVEDKNFSALAYNNLADALLFIGDWSRAESTIQSAMRLLKGGQSKRDEAAVFNTLGKLHFLQGRFELAETSLKRSVNLSLESGAKSLEAAAWLAVGQLMFTKGDFGEAVKHIQHCLAIETKIGRIVDMAETYSYLGESHIGLREFDQAEDCLKQAQRLLKDSPNLYHSGLVSRLEGKLKSQNSIQEEAISLLAQSISILESISYNYEAGLSHFEMGVILAQTADRQRARGHLEKALKIFSELRAEPARAKTVASVEDMRRTSLSGRLYLPVLTLDALVVERLIVAASSHDLLLRELATIIRDELGEQAVVYELALDNNLKLITARGADQTKVDKITEQVQAFLNKGGQLAEGAKVKILSDNINQPDTPARRFILYTTIDKSKNPARVGHFESLIKLVEQGLENCSLRGLVRTTTSQTIVSPTKATSQKAFSTFISSTPAMQKVLERIQKIRSSDVTVLITGESGVGKELIARSIHNNSKRHEKPFLPFNCAAVPADLVESRLFGHRRGAFTGADKDSLGIVRAATGGTLFLDEIGELAMHIQPKLLRFLQEHEIHPVGDDRPVKADVRIVAATNRDLEKCVTEGTFREDLFHRLNVIRIHIPSLRERKDDVPPLVNHFLQDFAKKCGKQLSLSPQAMEALVAFPWPGNVRQLKNEMERVTALAEDGTLITPENLSPEILRPKASFSSSGMWQSFIDFTSNIALSEAVDGLERYMIENTLKRHDGNITRAAKDLGLTRQGLILKKKRLGISIAVDENE
ncbi:MAG: sigma 54-interacting transcriptional regulator [Acidobacteria bacterium]|nr:sigma 54-interacting transcriptional regulator [Acidobacteriota bacterium]